jgi:hypothetical protein
MKHVALIGYMGSGKTAVRLRLQEKGYIHVSFATPLKNIVVKILGRSIDKQIDRPLLQRLGNGARSVENILISDRLIDKSVRINALSHILWPEGIDRSTERLDPFFDENYDTGFGDPNYWVNQCVRTMSELYYKDIRFVVDDMRYQNEAKTLIDLGFNIFRLEVPLEEVKRRLTVRDGGYDEQWFTDTSELEHLKIKENLVIDNTKSINEVYQVIADYLDGNLIIH